MRYNPRMYGLTLAILLSATPTPSPAPRSPEELREHRQRTDLGLAGMGGLTSWAVVNLAGGITGMLTNRGPIRFFHQGNAAWNTVNLALGIGGWVGQLRDRREPVDRMTGRARAERSQLIFAINAGVDVLYIGAGAVAWLEGQARAHPRIRGYGQALVLQGAFLFAFDAAMVLGYEWLLQRAPQRPRHSVWLYPSLQPYREGGVSVGVSIRRSKQ